MFASQSLRQPYANTNYHRLSRGCCKSTFSPCIFVMNTVFAYGKHFSPLWWLLFFPPLWFLQYYVIATACCNIKGFFFGIGVSVRLKSNSCTSPHWCANLFIVKVISQKKGYLPNARGQCASHVKKKNHCLPLTVSVHGEIEFFKKCIDLRAA